MRSCPAPAHNDLPPPAAQQPKQPSTPPPTSPSPTHPLVCTPFPSLQGPQALFCAQVLRGGAPARLHPPPLCTGGMVWAAGGQRRALRAGCPRAVWPRLLQVAGVGGGVGSAHAARHTAVHPLTHSAGLISRSDHAKMCCGDVGAACSKLGSSCRHRAATGARRAPVSASRWRAPLRAGSRGWATR